METYAMKLMVLVLLLTPDEAWKSSLSRLDFKH